MSKSKAPICRCSYGSWMSSPSGVCKFPPKFIDGGRYSEGIAHGVSCPGESILYGSTQDVWRCMREQGVP